MTNDDIINETVAMLRVLDDPVVLVEVYNKLHCSPIEYMGDDKYGYG